MNNEINYFIIFFVFVLCISAEFINRYQKRKSRQFFIEHNRKVMLGVTSDAWDTDIKSECVHSDNFFLLENSGTYDTSYIVGYEYNSFISEEDLFLED